MSIRSRRRVLVLGCVSLGAIAGCHRTAFVPNSTAVPLAQPQRAQYHLLDIRTDGTIIPLYTYPTDASWTTLIGLHQQYPSVPILAVINPSNGVGRKRDATYSSGIQRLQAAGIQVLGYVQTNYGSRSLRKVDAEIDTWKSWYLSQNPAQSGIFLDEMASKPGKESYYTSITQHEKSLGLGTICGNPGTDIASSYLGSVDTMILYESPGLPALTAYAAPWYSQADRFNFGIMPYGVASFDATYVQNASGLLGYIYVQSDSTPNPWDTLPPYLDQLLATLAANPH